MFRHYYTCRLRTCSRTAPAVQETAGIARDSVIRIVQQIQRADYEGDRAALNQLYQQLVPFVDEPEIATRVRYWRGFAKWRRGINGLNETPTPKDLAEDLTEGESEFDAAIQRDPGFVDAKAGAASCAVNRLFLEGVFSKEKDPQRLKGFLAPVSQLIKEAREAAPDNPRLLWVVEPISGALLQSGEAARTKRWQPIRKVWMPSGSAKRALAIRWSQRGENLNCCRVSLGRI